MMKKNKNLVLILSLIAALSFIVNCGEDFDVTLKATSLELNEQCPMTIDEYTRLDNTETHPGKIFQYNYTLTTEDAGVLNTDPKSLGDQIKQQSLMVVKTNADLQIFRDNEVTLVYVYNKLDGSEFFRFEILPEEYK